MHKVFTSWIELFSIHFQLLKEERLQGATLLVLANKQDLVGAATHDEIRQLLKLGETKYKVLNFSIFLIFRRYKNTSLVH